MPLTSLVEDIDAERVAARRHPALPAARRRLGRRRRRARRSRSSRPTRSKRSRTGAAACKAKPTQEAGRRARRPGAAGRDAVGDRLPPAAHRRAGDPPRHPGVGAPTSLPGRRRGAARGDRGVARRPGRRLPPAAPGHGRLVRAVVLAAHRGPRSTARVEPPTLDAVVRRAADDPRPQPASGASASAAGRRRSAPATSWDELGRGRGDSTAASPARDRSTTVLRDAPVARGVRADRRAAGLLPLGARLRPGLRARRLRPPGRKPAVGAAAIRRRRAARRGRSVVAARAQADAGAGRRQARAETLALPGMPDLVVDGTADVACTGGVRRVARAVPAPAGSAARPLPCFMEQTWRHGSPRGIIGTDPS